MATPIKGNSTTGSGTAITVALATNAAGGNLIVYGFSADDVATSVTAGVLAVNLVDGTNFLYTEIYYVANCPATTNSVTRNTAASATMGLSIEEYSGSTGTLDKTQSGSGFGTAALTAATTTTTSPNELLIGVGGCTAADTFLPGASYAERWDSGGVRPVHFEDQNVSATGAYTASATVSSTTNWQYLIATFIDGSVAAPAPTFYTAPSGPPGRSVIRPRAN